MNEDDTRRREWEPEQGAKEDFEGEDGEAIMDGEVIADGDDVVIVNGEKKVATFGRANTTAWKMTRKRALTGKKTGI